MKHELRDDLSGLDADPRISRRGFIRDATVAGIALGAGASLASCAAAPAVVEAVFNPATVDWLSQLALAVGATEVEKVLEDGLKYAWEKWRPGVRKAVASQPRPDDYYYQNAWVHPIPPVVLIGMTKGRHSSAVTDPMTDHLLACVEGGRSYVEFQPWAWQTLSMLVHQLTQGKSGSNLEQTKQLCVLTLVPSGTRPSVGESPEGTVGWLTYKSRNGHVEIAWSRRSQNTWNGTITASAIPDAQGNPLSMTFPLPTNAA
jgi:hypothetical protein